MSDIVKDATFYRIKQIELAEAEYYKSLIATLDRIEREVVSSASKLPLTDGKLVELQAAIAIRPQIKSILEREYLALVWGDVKNDEGEINAPIGRNPKNRLQMIVYEDLEGGKDAITKYKVIERFGYVTLVSCKLKTGRTHQIRVHMKYLGHTLFNDERYGGNKILKGTVYSKYKQFVENCFEMLPRQALHAKTLGFIHPKTKENILFDSDIPIDMNSVIEKWRGYSKHKNL